MEFVGAQELFLPDGGVGDVVDACFHPQLPYVYLATSSSIFTYDLVSGALCSRWSCGWLGRLVSVGHSPQQMLLAALFDSGDVAVLSTADFVLQLAWRQKLPPGKTPVTAFAVGSSPPVCFFLRKESGQLFSVVNPPQKPLPKFEAKRHLVSLAFLPVDGVVAVGAVDGRVQLVNVGNAAVVFSSDEFSRIDRPASSSPPHQPHFLVFDSARDLLFAASRDGLLAVWQAFQDVATAQWRLDRFASVQLGPIKAISLGYEGALHVLHTSGLLTTYSVYPSTTGFAFHASGFIERQRPMLPTRSSHSLSASAVDAAASPLPTTTTATAGPSHAKTSSGSSQRTQQQLQQQQQQQQQLLQQQQQRSGSPSIRAMHFHQYYNCALFLPDNGSSEQPTLVQSSSSLARPQAVPPTSASSVSAAATADLNSAWHASVSDLGGEYGRTLWREPVLLYSLVNHTEDHRFLPVVSPQTLPSSFFLQQKPLFTFPQAIFPYVDGGRLLGFDIARRGIREIKELPEFDIMYDRPLHVRRLRYSPKLEHFLVFYEIDVGENQQSTHRYSYFSGNDESLKEGSDGCFLGPSHSHMALLTTNGRKIKVMPTTADAALAGQPLSSRSGQNSVLLLEFPPSKTVRRVFPSCQPYGVVYWISTPEHHGLFPSVSVAQGYQSALFHNFVPEQGLSFEVDTSYYLSLETSSATGERETVVDVQWQSFTVEDRPTHDLAAVLTSARLLIINGNFEVVTCIHSSHPGSPTPFLSCLWLDTCLLYTTPTHLNYLALDGTSHSVCSVEPGSVLCAVQNDRVYSAAYRQGRVQIFAHNVGLLEPLLLGLSSIRGFLGLPDASFQELYQRALRRFDSGRITSHLLNSLRANQRHDLVFALIKNSSVQPPGKKFFAALRSRQFETAFDILRTKYKAWYLWHSNKVRSLDVFSSSPSALLSLRSSPLDYRHGSSLQYLSEPDEDISVLPSASFDSDTGHKYPLALSFDSPLYQQFAVLARTCIQHGQFELARRCYVLMDDRLSLLRLYTVHCSRQGVEAIAKVSLRENQAPVSAQCERLLHVRHLTNVQFQAAAAQPDDASGNSQDDQSLDDEIDSSVAEYSQLGLKNWSFVTPAVNWDTSLITSATMRVLGRTLPPSFVDIEPVGFLDTLDKWLPVPLSAQLGKGWTFGKPEDEMSPGRSIAGPNDRRILHILPFASLSIDPLPSLTASSSITSSSRPRVASLAVAYKPPDGKQLVDGGSNESKTIELSRDDFELVPLRLVAYLLEPPSLTLPDKFSFVHSVLQSPTVASASAAAAAFPRSLSLGSDLPSIAAAPAPPPLAPPDDQQQQSPAPTPTLPSSSSSSSSSSSASRGPPPAVPPLPPLPSVSAHILKPDSQRDRKPHDYVGLAWQKLDGKQYPGALDDISHAIRLFVPPSPENNLMIKFCALYKLALKILIEIKLLHQSSDKERVVQLATYLADIPILPVHRIPFLETAIQLCLESAKIETARRLFKLLQTKQPANIEQLRRRLIQSRAQPHQVELHMSDAGGDGDREVACFPICYQSLQLLPPGSPYLTCIICESCYSEKEKKLGEACAVCNNGKLKQQSA